MTFGQYYGIIPPTGEFASAWPSNYTLPQGLSGLLSSAGWTRDFISPNENLIPSNFGNEGFVQQTFLGASIRDFTLNAGFGSNSSSLSVNLVNDEFNSSDGIGLGGGDDAYHNGFQDTFLPPVVGAPVYFKFGKNPATVEQAYRQTFDDLYGLATLEKNFPRSATNIWGYDFPKASAPKPRDENGVPTSFSPAGFESLSPYYLYDSVTETIEDRSALWNTGSFFRGRNHFAFGGILQSYTQNNSPTGKPTYAVTVQDPREILANVQVLLKNYAGSVYNNKNIINVYGFLEHEIINQNFYDGYTVGIVQKVEPGRFDDIEDIGVRTDDGSFIAVGAITGIIAYDVPESETGGTYSERIGNWLTIGNSYFPANVTIPSRPWNSADGKYNILLPEREVNMKDEIWLNQFGATSNDLPEFFPITGRGFSRQSDAGMPWYRIQSALGAIFQLDKEPLSDSESGAAFEQLSKEYQDAGFGGRINFRGYNYIVDFGGIPTDKIPPLYYFDYDKLDLLSLAQELCDVISHDLYVTLLPVIDHPACGRIFKSNNKLVKQGKYNQVVAGIIRLDAIDRTKQPTYGAIKSYIDNLSFRGINVKSSDVGFELSNITTDKFLVGGQTVDMTIFDCTRDKDTLMEIESKSGLESDFASEVSKLEKDQWSLKTQLTQQMIPYFGLIGESAVSIPKGFGDYKQILLDSTGLNAFGVGDYYVATEMELRAATVSFDKWKNFLLTYNDVYIEDIAEHGAIISQFGDQESKQMFDAAFDDLGSFASEDSEDITDEQIDTWLNNLKSKTYAVTVPRSVWPTVGAIRSPGGVVGGERSKSEHERVWETSEEFDDEGEININIPNPKLTSPCNPPYGWPLYFGRAREIGIVEAGIAKVIDAKTKLIKQNSEIKKQYENPKNPFVKNALNAGAAPVEARLKQLQKTLAKKLKENEENLGEFKQTPGFKALVTAIEQAKKSLDTFQQIKNEVEAGGKLSVELTDESDDEEVLDFRKFLYNINNEGKKHTANAKKVYQFVKAIADECLGKKFLVKIPNKPNYKFSPKLGKYFGSENANEFGPFGFIPRVVNQNTVLSDEAKQLAIIDYYKVWFSAPGFDDLLSMPDDFLGVLQNPEGYPEMASDIQRRLSSDITQTVPIHPYNAQRGFGESTTRLDSNDALDLELKYGVRGGIKSNFNPFSQEWEFNYKPEPQGGHFPLSLWGNEASTVTVDPLISSWENAAIVQQQSLCPFETSRITKDSSRFGAYVKFENSHLLDFSNISSDKMIQEFSDTGGIDIAETMPNNQETKPDLSFNSLEDFEKTERLKETPKKAIAYVSVDVDEKLYMPPRLIEVSTPVYATGVDLALTIPFPDIIYAPSEDGCVNVPTVDFSDGQAVFTPTVTREDPAKLRESANVDMFLCGESFGGGEFGEDYQVLINTRKRNLDNRFVYALITLPGRVQSNAETRWRDGPLQAFKGVEKKHLMTQDVVKIEDFSLPAYPDNTKDADAKAFCGDSKDAPVFETRREALEDAADKNIVTSSTHYRPDDKDRYYNTYYQIPLPTEGYRYGKKSDWLDVSLGDITSALAKSKQINKAIALQSPGIDLGYIAPSPIHPEFVVLPLMSMERCYGPWQSAFASTSVKQAERDPDKEPTYNKFNFSDIGGKVEFEKDENLAPWNYNGYRGMQEAAEFKVQFSNSLLLFSERGGFQIPDAPTGISLATALKKGGPLITDIGVSVGSEGLTTTVKMDLYTSKFGKLSQLKEKAIERSARERQKRIDLENSSIRRGLGKRQTSGDLVESVMQNGGEKLMKTVSSQAAWLENQKDLGKAIDDTVVVVGPNGEARTMTTETLSRIMSQQDAGDNTANLEDSIIIRNGNQLVPFSNQPSDTLPSKEPTNSRSMNKRQGT